MDTEFVKFTSAGELFEKECVDWGAGGGLGGGDRVENTVLEGFFGSRRKGENADRAELCMADGLQMTLNLRKTAFVFG
jgi:hypothetical protein